MMRYLSRTDGKAMAEAPETPSQKDLLRGWSVGQSVASLLLDRRPSRSHEVMAGQFDTGPAAWASSQSQ